MMRISWDQPRIAPEELYILLRRHCLLPLHLDDKALLRSIKATADASRFGMVLDGDGVLASTLTLMIEPGILSFHWIPEVKRLHTRRNELIDLGGEFRSVWFVDGIRRVEARCPILRTQTMRCLQHMGFRLETTDKGLRKAVDYGKGFEALALFGLIESDPPREKRVEEPEAQQEEVANV